MLPWPMATGTDSCIQKITKDDTSGGKNKLVRTER